MELEVNRGLTAKEAKEQTRKNKESRENSEFTDVCGKIQANVGMGHYTCILSVLSATSVERFRNLGYSVETVIHYNDSYIRISWE